MLTRLGTHGALLGPVSTKACKRIAAAAADNDNNDNAVSGDVLTT